MTASVRQSRQRKGIVTWLRAWRPVARLGWRDALRHGRRTAASILLITLAITALIGGVILVKPVPVGTRRALASLPEGAQARITATAVSAWSEPLAQIPEGVPGGWMDDTDQQPAKEAQLLALLPKGDSLARYWTSPQLIATTKTTLKPGEQSQAGDRVASSDDIDLAHAVTTTLTEASTQALKPLLPEFISGSSPVDGTGIVVSSALAQRLDLKTGDTVTFVAPPATGMISTTDGRIAEAIQNSQRAWTVSGVARSSDLTAWSREGWLSAMVKQDPYGVDAHYYLLGDEPLTWLQIKELNRIQTVAVSRYVLTAGYPSPQERYPTQLDLRSVLQDLVAICITAVLGISLALFMLTPAFTVSAEQSRRMMGLAGAIGAGPTDVWRIVAIQGLASGLIGGTAGAVFGTALGIALSPIINQAHPTLAESLANFPWMIIPAGIAVAVVIGLAATRGPARYVAQLDPATAIKDMPGTLADHHPRDTGRRFAMTAARLLGPVSLAASAAFAIGSLHYASPVAATGDAAPGAVSGGTLWPTLLLVTALCFALVGIIAMVRSSPNVFAHIGARAPLAIRLGLRDASEHRSRFVPATTAVLITVAICSYYLVFVGSLSANEDDMTLEAVDGSSMIVSAQPMVSNSFDRLVTDDAIKPLEREGTIKADFPIYTEQVRASDISTKHGTESHTTDAVAETDGLLYATVLQPEGSVRCEGTSRQDAISALIPGTPMRCVAESVAYTPALMGFAFGSTAETLIMDGDAMRASGFADADRAADILDAGGFLVSNAAMIDGNGMVTVTASHHRLDTEAKESVHMESRQAMFLRGAYPLIMSLKTAEKLGITTLRYIGSYVVPAKARYADTVKLGKRMQKDYPLTVTSISSTQIPWGSDIMLLPALLLVVLALAATIISIALARTQSVRDMTTMHAVGATPKYLHLFGLSQAMVILFTGVPLGMLGGFALGGYQIAWNRHIAQGGAWLRTVPLWGMQAIVGIGTVLVGLLFAWLITNPPKRMTRRSID